MKGEKQNMNKLFTKIAKLSLGLAMAAGVGVAVSAGRKDASPAKAAATSYTITFNGSNSESTSISTSTTAASITGSSPYVTGNVAVATKTYGATSNGVKIGASGSSGSLKINLSSSGQVTPTSVVVNCKLYNSGKSATLKVNGSATQSVPSSSGNLTFSITSAITYLQFDSSKYIWVKSATVNYNSGPTKLATPTGLNYDSTNQQVKWNSVSNASGYKFSSNNGTSYSSTTTNLYYDVSSLTNGQTYTCKVYAVGDGSSYSDSDAASYEFTKTAPASYTGVTVEGGELDGTEKGSAYIQCSASATGTNIPASPSFTWYVTETNTYGTSTSVTNKASISNTGKVTFADNCTVYVWALAPDGSTHNTSGYAATASGLTDPKGSEANPYSVSEARGVATTTANNTHVRGIIYEVSSYSSTYKSLTYWISDDGTGVSSNKDGLQIYSGKGLNGADFSSTSDLTVGSTVVVKGDLKIYSSTTYELDKNSVIKSIQLPKTLSSIAVQTAPTKTAYKSGETFDPTGLVIRATYSDETYEDVTYSAGISGSFTFTPSTITAAGNVTITYREKTCTQAVTLITVTKVDSVKSAPSEVYKDGSIDPDDVTLNVTYSDNSKGEVKATSVSCDTSAIATGVTATASYSGATGTPNSATFTIDVVKEPVYDTVVDELVVGDTGITGTTYGTWSGVSKASGAIYAGATNENSNGGIGMRADTSKDPSGIWVTSSSGVATKVEVVWTTTTSRTVYVFGKDTAYTGANHYSNMEGTQIGSFSYSSTSVDLTTECQYIAICVTGGAAGFSKIKITWKVEGADYPLTANPTLSTGAAASVTVGKNLALAVTTTPANSDERLLVSSSNENYVTVAGSGKSFTIHGVAVGSATVTVKGAKGTYQSTTTITVTAAVKTYEDKILNVNSLGLTNSYNTDTSTAYPNDGVDYTCYNVMKTNGMQFKSSPAGYISNKEVLYTGTYTEIKSITLIMNSHNTGYITAYEGTDTDPDQDVCNLVGTWNQTGVNTYTFSSGMTYFKLLASGTTNVDEIIIELVDNADSILGEARLAATAILTDLSGLCGGDDAPGFVTQSDWNTLTSDLTALNLSANAKQFLKDAPRISLDNLSQGGAEIENAMAHYDACVEKFGFTPFTGITNAQPSPKVNPLVNIIGENTNTVAIIVIISMVSVTAIGGYFFLRKRKENN